MSFQRLVMLIAGIVLLVALIFMGYAIYAQRWTRKFPPVVGQCPDYWELQRDSSGKGVCVNAMDLGSCKSNMNFNLPPYNGIDGMCRKAQWARGCNLTWDGITNNPKVCD